MLEPVYNLFNTKDKNASTAICRLVSIFLSQFFHKRRHFSSQANERSTIHRFGITTGTVAKISEVFVGEDVDINLFISI